MIASEYAWWLHLTLLFWFLGQFCERIDHLRLLLMLHICLNIYEKGQNGIGSRINCVCVSVILKSQKKNFKSHSSLLFKIFLNRLKKKIKIFSDKKKSTWRFELSGTNFGPWFYWVEHCICCKLPNMWLKELVRSRDIYWTTRPYFLWATKCGSGERR